ncbi:hypothetical protein SKAU_G00006500 [Synaphobranchus kaupii]|uniref:Uncharacterized protein n=1 Tax=Synaphobranchus kaupii TaxID=118154 RepID=A0A9Q1JCW7_SYNKA|nr:hypothetical protein SKAU_G00006500 [Synaphobranchus kaupii]
MDAVFQMEAKLLSGTKSQILSDAASRISCGPEAHAGSSTFQTPPREMSDGPLSLQTPPVSAVAAHTLLSLQIPTCWPKASISSTSHPGTPADPAQNCPACLGTVPQCRFCRNSVNSCLSSAGSQTSQENPGKLSPQKQELLRSSLSEHAPFHCVIPDCQ